MTYLELIERVAGYTLTATDPYDYHTINWILLETTGTQVADDIVYTTVERPIDPIPQDELDNAYREMLYQMLDTCIQEKILSGFESSALGSPHLYKSDYEGQINLIGAVLAGQDLHYTCVDVATGTKERRLHTAAQIQQVFADGVMYKETLITKYHQMRAEIATLTGRDLLTYQCQVCGDSPS